MKYNQNVYRALVMITQFSVNMLVPIFLCSFLGIFLDKKLGTSWLVILFFFIGAMAGGRNVYVFAKKIFDNKNTNIENYGSGRKIVSKDEGTDLKQEQKN